MVMVTEERVPWLGFAHSCTCVLACISTGNACHALMKELCRAKDESSVLATSAPQDLKSNPAALGNSSCSFTQRGNGKRDTALNLNPMHRRSI